MSWSKRLVFAFLFIGLFIVSACAPAAPAPRDVVNEAPAAPAPAMENQVDIVMQEAAAAVPVSAEAALPEGKADTTIYNTGKDAAEAEGAPDPNRKIIKNAELQILVEETDIAIDRITQIADDVGGYIVSSKSWFKDEIGGTYKYATLTLGVPVDDFERALRRLREVSINVENEVTTGEDVSQEYVDLQSKLESLQATRARITGFLENAQSVEEALRINDQLGMVEQQINETLGRMNYLAGRASFSTITVTINPRIREVTPTPTLTPTNTPTPMPTFTPTPWQPGKTLNQASHKLGNTYRELVDGLIWFLIYTVPVLLPWVVIIFVLYMLFRGKIFKRVKKTSEKDINPEEVEEEKPGKK